MAPRTPATPAQSTPLVRKKKKKRSENHLAAKCTAGRKRVGRRSNKVSSRRDWTVEEKLRLIDLVLVSGRSKASVRQEYSLDKKQFRTWFGKAHELRNTARNRCRLHGGGVKTKLGRLEEEIYKWFKEQRSDGCKVNSLLLRIEAARLVEEEFNGWAAANDVESIHFEGEKGMAWVKRWCKRYRVCRRYKTHAGRRIPAELEGVIQEFRKAVIYERRYLISRTGADYELACVANKDQLCMRMAPTGRGSRRRHCRGRRRHRQPTPPLAPTTQPPRGCRVKRWWGRGGHLSPMSRTPPCYDTHTQHTTHTRALSA